MIIKICLAMILIGLAGSCACLFIGLVFALRGLLRNLMHPRRQRE